MFKEEIPEYIEKLEKDKEEVDDFNKICIDRRLEKLKSFTATYYVGGATPQEMEERFYRIEDAVLACAAAIKHNGVIIGGGVTYLNVYDILKKNNEPSTDFEIGYNAVLESLIYPFKKLCENSYIKDYVEIYDTIRNNDYKIIYNFAKEEYEKENEISIYDTTKTAKVALEAAISVTSTILLTSAIIS